MRIDARTARLAAIAGWASLFVVLWATGASSRYLGARTQWLVPFGAITLVGALVLSARAPRRGAGLRAGEGAGLLLLFVPLVAALLVPHAELGAYAASRKSTGFFPAVRPRPPATPRDVTLLDVEVAQRDDLYALALVEESFEEHVRVLGDDVHVPVARAVAQVEGERVIGLRDQAKADQHARELHHRVHAVQDAQRERQAPNVCME
jgi:hypothetical protein